MDNWKITHLKPQTIDVTINGFVFSGVTIGSIMSQYSDHLVKSSSTLPYGWENDVYEAIHRKYPMYVRKKGGISSIASYVSLSSMITFIEFARKRLFDKTLVSADVAKSRADICAKCKYATFSVGCAPCRDVLEKLVKPPEEIKCPVGCRACGCYLPLKVWIPEHQLRVFGKYPYSDVCWMPKDEGAGGLS